MKPFIAETKREELLLKWLWNTLEEFDECLVQYVPMATSRETNAYDFIRKLREKFPVIHKKYSARLYKRMRSNNALPQM